MTTTAGHTLELGDRAKDRITGFEGLVTGRCAYISGCDQVLLSPPTGEQGEFRDAHWFDVDRCEVLERGAVRIADVSSPARPGPDAPAPTK